MATRRTSLRRRLRREYVRYSPELAVQLCERVAAGEMVWVVCREEGMPSHSAVAKWAKQKPDFAEALAEARAAGGRPVGTRGGVWSYCAETAQTIFERLCAGEGLSTIGKDPTMPSVTTLFYWRQRIPEFEELVQLAREIQADLAFEQGRELADAATPETAYLTHVRLTHLRWATGVLEPRVFRIKTVEPKAPPKTTTVLFRHFKIEEDPETGEKKVVAYCPNPHTGKAEREDTPGWVRPHGPNIGCLPGG